MTDQGTTDERTERTIPVRVFIAPMLVVLLAVAGVGGFLLGQSTRQSDDQVRADRIESVNTAVHLNNAANKEKRVRMMERAEKKLKQRNKVVLRRVVKKLKKAAERKARESYASGSSAGFNNGHSAGEEDGLRKGSDSLTCSDDPDVTWLPGCYFGE